MPNIFRDNINYFYSLGETYPDEAINKSPSKLFCRLFRSDKNQFIAKVLNPKSVVLFTDIKLALYQKNCLLFIEFKFFADNPSGNFSISYPIDPIAMLADRSKYPEDDEAMDFEFHFIDELDNKLLKVIRFNACNVEFSILLKEEFKHLLDSKYNAEYAKSTLQDVLAGRLGKELTSESNTFIVKQGPVENEPMQSNEYMSVLDKLRVSGAGAAKPLN